MTSDGFGPFAKYITDYFGMDMVLPMNTGAEGVEVCLSVPDFHTLRRPSRLPVNGDT